MSSSSGIGIVKAGRGVVYLVYFFVVLCLVILTLGFFLLLFGANPDAPFSEWVYRALDRAMKPFRGIFQSIPLNGQSVLDVSIVFAMVVYGMLAMALRSRRAARRRDRRPAGQVIWYSGPSPPSGVVSRPPFAVIAPHCTQFV
jgi:uncharacterized protein YggT (Ycf19 family)